MLNPWLLIALIALALWLATLWMAPPQIVVYKIVQPGEDDEAGLPPCPCPAHPICLRFPPPPMTGVALEARVVQISRN